ncbi:MAG: GNAT family N-acetyltransferase [Candidatus Fusobacterium pullicola]|uniref:GNAT family N-acetyltransferase n=1 Tax=Candidatus Fusobacterium pullicola TaxID=2838601 RepID=A0A9E2NWE3_9FUSO|nr:GNAT family N-acetyltransferase [Candidatus Fusobacterium pullicola]
MLNFKRINKTKEIERLLYKYNDNFSPRISTIVKNMQEYAKKLAEKSYFYSIINFQEEIGILGFYLNLDLNQCYINLICLKREHQNKGLGYYILKFCEKEVRKYKISRIRLEVYKNNKKAISFYKNNNFKKENIESEKTYHLVKLLEEE